MQLDSLTAKILPQFRHSPYLTRVLDSMQPHRQAEGYELTLRCVPDYTNILVAGNATYEGRVTLPNGACLYAISGSSTAAAGFDLNIRNSGNQADLCGRRAFFPNVTGQPAPSDRPYSPMFYLPRPLLFLEPAQLLAQIWNKDANPNTIQVVLWFYSPEVPRSDHT